MASLDAKSVQWELAEWQDPLGVHECIFSNMRIDRDTIPSDSEWKYLYEVRDASDGVWYEIALGIMVNHWGTVLTKKPIDFKLYPGESIKVIDYSHSGELIRL